MELEEKDVLVVWPTSEVELSQLARKLEELLNGVETNDDIERAMDKCFEAIFRGDPKEQQEKLGLKKPRVCGKIWSKGGMAYRCHNCEVTNNSCICAECFQAGDHRGHDYSLYSSSYGGCCDCGDPYAWKPEGFCKHHQPQSDEEIENNPNRQKVLLIAKTVIGVVVKFFRACLQDAISYFEEKVPLPPFEQFQINTVACWIRKACSYGEDLRRTACAEISATSPLETSQSTKVWTEASFLQGLLRLCCILPKPLEMTNMLLDLLYDVEFKVEFARQFVRMYNVLFLHSIDATKGKRLRNTLSTISAQLFNIQELMVMLVKEEGLLNSMFYCSLAFFRQILTIRRDLNTGSLKERQEAPMVHSDASEDSSEATQPPPQQEAVDMELSAPLYSIDYEDDEDENYEADNPENEAVNDNEAQNTAGFEEVDLVINCSDTLTDSNATARLFSEMQLTLRYDVVVHHFLWENSELFDRCLHLLRLVQYMNPNIRETTVHVEYETNSFKHAISLDSRITSLLIEPSINGYKTILKNLAKETNDVSSVVQKSLQVIVPCAKALRSWLDYCNLIVVDNSRWKEKVYPIIQSNSNIVSYHLPLHRLFASLVQVVSSFDYEVLFRHLASGVLDDLLPQLIDQPLLIQVLNSQIRAGYWKRNGEETMWLQRYFYNSHILYHQCEMDLFLLQVGCANMDPDHFVLNLIYKFGLENWFVLVDEVRTKVPDLEDRYVFFAEDMLRLILTILIDRSNSGAIDWVRKQAIAWLCVNDQTFTELAKKITNLHDSHLHSLLEDVLDKISIVEKGKFKLKKELWSEFDPYFLHYSENDVQNAIERYQQLFPNSPSLPPPYLPTYHLLDNLQNLLHSRLLHALLYCILYNCNSQTDRFSETLLDYCLHLIHLAIASSSGDCDIENVMDGCNPETPIQSVFDIQFNSDSFIASSLQEFTIGDSTSPESFITLLIKLAKSKKRKETVSAILQLLASKHPYCQNEITKHSPEEQSDENAAKLEARRRRQEILAQFSAKQQSFSASLGESFDEDEEDEATESKNQKVYPVCVVCKEASSPHGPRPVGLVGLCQRSAIPLIVKKPLNSNFLAKHQTHIVQHEEDSSVSPVELAQNEQTELLQSFANSPAEGGASNSTILSFILSLLNSFSRDATPNTPPMSPSITNSESQSTDVLYGKLMQGVDDNICVNLNTCGHYIHFECLHQFLQARATSAQQLRPTSDEALLNKTEKDWFWCPICRSLSNVLIPVVPTSDEENEMHTENDLTFDSWFSRISKNAEKAAPISMTEPASSIVESLKKFAFKLYSVAKNILLPGASIDSNELGVFLLRVLAFNIANKEIELRGVIGEKQLPLSASLHLPTHSGLASQSSSSSASTSVSSSTKLLLSIMYQAVFSYFRWCTQKVRLEKPLQAFLTSVIPSVKFQRSILDFLPSHSVSEIKRQPLLTLDMFSLLTKWIVIYNNSAEITPQEVFYMIRVCYAGALIQAILTIPHDENDNSSWSKLQQKIQQGMPRLDSDTVFSSLSDLKTVESKVKALCLPFLRQAALFVHTCWQQKIMTQTAADPQHSDDEFEELRRYLRLPIPTELFESAHISDLVAEWLEDLGRNKRPKELYPLRQFGLMSLPPLFQDLFHMTIGAKCHNCNKTPVNPALCLICGEILCANDSCCAKDGMGECFRHSIVCGAGSGIVIMLQTSLVLLIRDERCSCWGSPYLDVHKEEDIFLDRGKALYLEESIYKDLARYIVQHRLDSAILRDNVSPIKSAQKSRRW